MKIGKEKLYCKVQGSNRNTSFVDEESRCQLNKQVPKYRVTSRNHNLMQNTYFYCLKIF